MQAHCTEGRLLKEQVVVEVWRNIKVLRLRSSGFPSPQSSPPMAVMTGVTRMTARLGSAGIQSGGLSPSTPSFSSLLGNPACIFFRHPRCLTLPRRHPPQYAQAPPLMCKCPTGGWLCSSGFPSPQSSPPMAVMTEVTRMTG